MGWLESLFDLRCPGCAQAIANPVLCATCLTELRPHHYPQLIYLGRYQRWKRVCRALKYGGQWPLARVLAAPLAVGVTQAGWQLDGITAVPLHPLRWLQRGYNQSERLARALALFLGLPYRSTLQRRRYSRSQAQQDLAGRTHLDTHTFAPVASVQGRWILVDDVITSGTTLRLARRALYQAGAEQVYVACIAVRQPNPQGLFVL